MVARQQKVSRAAVHEHFYPARSCDRNYRWCKRCHVESKIPSKLPSQIPHGCIKSVDGSTSSLVKHLKIHQIFLTLATQRIATREETEDTADHAQVHAQTKKSGYLKANPQAWRIYQMGGLLDWDLLDWGLTGSGPTAFGVRQFEAVRSRRKPSEAVQDSGGWGRSPPKWAKSRIGIFEGRPD